MFAIIRIRGSVKTKKEIVYTLKMLRLHHKHNCILMQEGTSQMGMLNKVKDYVTWGEISGEILKKLVAKRGRLAGNKRVAEKDIDTFLNDVKTKKAKEWTMKPVFRLSPPSKGFHGSIRLHYPKGELGYRKDKINDLLERMI